MKMFNFYQCILFFLGVLLSPSSLTEAETTGIVPELQVPCPSVGSSERLVVSFPSVGDIRCGVEYDITDINMYPEHPEVWMPDAEISSFYTLVMVDPDAPSSKNPTLRYILHWMVINIQGLDLLSGNIFTGDTVQPYEGPQPPVGSGPHRYYQLVFKQDGGLTSIVPPVSNANFDVIAFAETNNLGPLVAVNMFMTENAN